MVLSSRIEQEPSETVWSRSCSAPATASLSLSEDIQVDLAIVGGGYTGLSIARTAAEAGLATAVFEASQVGAGASGRNSGFVIPQFPGAITPASVETELGKKKGHALCELVATGPERVRSRIEAHGIECDMVQCGWTQPAHSEKSLSKVRTVFDQWKALGAPAEWLDADDIKTHLGASGYLGGWRHPEGSQLNPLALVRGLARIAVAKGVRLYERSAVTEITHSEGLTRMAVNGRTVFARKVVVATNGYTSALVSNEDRSAIPVHLFQVATRPLTEDERRVVNPSGGCFSDIRRSGGVARFDRNNRLITGGAVFALESSPIRLGHTLRG